jgi:hypothetical protein
MINQTQQVKCNCINAGQDKLNGKFIRVTTPCNKRQITEQALKSPTRTVRCTVCLKQHEIKI